MQTESDTTTPSPNTWRNFFSFEVPLWIAVVSLIILTAAITGVFSYYRNVEFPLRLPSDNKTQFLRFGAIPALAQPDYFSEVKNSFIEKKTAFIEADLSAMKITVYENGIPTLEIPIVTKGREGSWWETPAGIYKIETKEENHFSSIGKVYQPWSMQFQGNFFIHGWPYYEDGTEVSSTYSGGCIRLKTEDAKKLYDAVKIGMPVLVHEKDFGRDNFEYSINQPAISATQYLLADLKSNSVILSKDEATPAPIGSITKLVSALVAAEYINLDKEISYNEGQQISVYNLMFPLLMTNSDEAATAISRQLGASRFIHLMNEKAKALGMTQARFVDAQGEGDTNEATPSDLFALAKYLHNNRSFILNISAGSITSSIYGTPIFRNMHTIHVPEGTEKIFVGGIKDSIQNGSEVFLGIFNVTVKGEKRPVVIALLNTRDAFGDTLHMLEYIEKYYK